MVAPDLNAFVRAYHEALNEFFRGNPEPAKTLYSHREDATLANPFRPVAVGWAKVEETMERAASNYRDGRATGFETVASCVTPELAYLVEVERFEAKVGGADETASGALRVTSVLRAEGDAWKIVHRHADPITTPQAADSVIQHPRGSLLILAIHQTPTLTQERYEEVVRRLTGKSRIESPSDLPFGGLLVHAAGQGPNGFCVFDVFESEAAVERFRSAIGTIPQDVGIEEPPEFFAAHTAMSVAI